MKCFLVAGCSVHDACLRAEVCYLTVELVSGRVSKLVYTTVESRTGSRVAGSLTNIRGRVAFFEGLNGKACRLKCSVPFYVGYVTSYCNVER